jgi:hypothetical protein
MIPKEIAASINPKMFAYIVNLVFTHITSRDGMIETLNIKAEDGDYLKQYFSKNGLGEHQNEIDYRTLVKFTGYIFRNGKSVSFVHPSLIAEVNEPDLVECDSEHFRAPKVYCVIPVKGNDGRTYNLSNHARIYSEIQSIKATGDKRTCLSCRYTKCVHNPDHVAKMPPKQLEHSKDLPFPGMRL